MDDVNKDFHDNKDLSDNNDCFSHNVNSELSEANQENIELKVIPRQEETSLHVLTDENKTSCSSQGNLTELELLPNQLNLPSEKREPERIEQIKNAMSIVLKHAITCIGYIL